MKRIIYISEIGIAIMLAANGFSGTKISPPAAPSTAAGRLIEVAADYSPCPSPVPPDSRNQAYNSQLTGVASQKDDSRSVPDRQRGL
ncbi:MAG: hypothetical protein KME26_23365 [Oscillatoria princeps RMCB-10]|jgi:hypothetical protein|nr:hypothetical protein [Oscillatoria princeps RMCB-10]